MRRDVYEGVQLYVNKKIKPNYVELARQYHSGYRTVKTSYEQGIKNEKNGEQKRKVKNSRPSKRNPFKPIIEGKYTIVREYCKDHKAEKIKQATIFKTNSTLSN